MTNKIHFVEEIETLTVSDVIEVIDACLNNLVDGNGGEVYPLNDYDVFNDFVIHCANLKIISLDDVYKLKSNIYCELVCDLIRCKQYFAISGQTLKTKLYELQELTESYQLTRRYFGFIKNCMDAWKSDKDRLWAGSKFSMEYCATAPVSFPKTLVFFDAAKINELMILSGSNNETDLMINELKTNTAIYTSKSILVRGVMCKSFSETFSILNGLANMARNHRKGIGSAVKLSLTASEWLMFVRSCEHQFNFLGGTLLDGVDIKAAEILNQLEGKTILRQEYEAGVKIEITENDVCFLQRERKGKKFIWTINPLSGVQWRGVPG